MKPSASDAAARRSLSGRPGKALIAQSDGSVLLEVDAEGSARARAAVAPFAELVKSPEHVHTYRVTPLSVWNARAAGLTGGEMVSRLDEHSRYPVPASLAATIEDLAGRYGRVRLGREGDSLLLSVQDRTVARLLIRDRLVGPLLQGREDGLAFRVAPEQRGALKQALIAAGYPAEDLAGYAPGDKLRVGLRERCLSGAPLSLRDYQREAVAAFHQGGSERGGSGVVVLPCGSGKTMVGLAALAEVGQTTLIVCTSHVSVRQWRRELLDKTDLAQESVAEYTGQTKEIGPVTLTTYQVLTWRPDRDGDFPHMGLFLARRWGLIVYDEVHLLPAPVFQVTAQLQAKRRLGLTATLIREDGREADVFALIGPKRYDAPWKDLESEGWIAAAACTEIRVRLPSERRLDYALADERGKFRIAAENPAKAAVARDLAAKHAGDHVLLIGQYLKQLQALARDLDCPLITGRTPERRRQALYERFRAGTLRRLVLSKVGNFAIDLPDADVLIQVSGAFGSRQEEAQRLGRILRPKADGRKARFFTVVTQDTCEEEFAHHRQLFLTEQGYSYRLELDDSNGGGT